MTLHKNLKVGNQAYKFAKIELFGPNDLWNQKFFTFNF